MRDTHTSCICVSQAGPKVKTGRPGLRLVRKTENKTHTRTIADFRATLLWLSLPAVAVAVAVSVGIAITDFFMIICLIWGDFLLAALI